CSATPQPPSRAAASAQQDSTLHPKQCPCRAVGQQTSIPKALSSVSNTCDSSCQPPSGVRTQPTAQAVGPKRTQLSAPHAPYTPATNIPALRVKFVGPRCARRAPHS